MAAIAADMLPRVMAHGEEDHGTLVDLRELHGILLLAAWGVLIPVHVVLLLYYQWVRTRPARACPVAVEAARAGQGGL